MPKVFSQNIVYLACNNSKKIYNFLSDPESYLPVISVTGPGKIAKMESSAMALP